MKIGIYTSRVGIKVGEYNHVRIFKPLFQELVNQGHELVLLKDLPDQFKSIYGTDEAFDWTKFIKLGSLSEASTCDTIISFAVAFLGHRLKKEYLALVESYHGKIYHIDTDADFDKTDRNDKSMLQVIFEQGLAHKIHVLAPFMEQSKLYYDGKYEYSYFPYTYDPSEEVPVKAKSSKSYAIKFAGVPAYRQHLSNMIYFVAPEHPELKFSLNGGPWRGAVGWNQYTYLSDLPNVTTSNSAVYLEDSKFYEWLSESIIALQVGGGSSHGLIQRYFDALYAGCVLITDYVDESEVLGLKNLTFHHMGDFPKIVNSVLSMTDEKYINQVTELRRKANEHLNASVNVDRFMKAYNKYNCGGNDNE